MNLGVASDKSRQQTLALKEACRELERRQAERSLKDQMVDRHERDLRGAIAGIGKEAIVGGDKLVVKDRLEGRRDLLTGTLDVRGDNRRLGDDLVLEARVELHVPGLVDLLGGQERDFLLAAVRTHQPGELRRDSLLSNHQRT